MDGKRIATFVNERKTTQIELSCEVTIDFQEGTWQDEALIKGFQDREYEFILIWENAEGEQVEESVLLTGGTSEVLEAALPFGTDYVVEVVEVDAPYRTKLSDNFEGTVGTAELVGNILIEAVQTYTVKSGESAGLSLVKVDADTKSPLEGVEFLLKNNKGEELKTYISNEQGEMEIVDVFKAPGVYTLEETQTLEGYELLRSPLSIDVAAQYREEEENGAPVLIQTMTAEISGATLVQESDGSFWVENEREAAADDEEASGGPGIGMIIGLGAVGVAGAAGAAVLIGRKRRKK